MKSTFTVILLGILTTSVIYGQKSNKTPEEKLASEVRMFFDVERDKFDELNPELYKPKVRPAGLHFNGLYAKFKKIQEGPYGFELRVQYRSQSGWLHIRDIIFAIDGQVFKFRDLDVDSDVNIHSKASVYYEWTDIVIGASEEKFIRALANAKEAEMKLVGATYYDTKKVSKSNIQILGNTLYYFEQLGGKF